MYGKQHLLAYRSEEESKVIYFLSFRQLGWWFGGAFMSMKLATYLPPIPGLGYWGYLPYWIPFVVAVVFAHGKHFGTGLSLGKYLFSWIACRKRKREFLS